MSATICLCMIVKDEARVITRCLGSIKPFIDRWVICDTGSTDGTQDIIRSFMAGTPGELHERPWVNFGFNRTEALELARAQGCDYTFVIDADEVLDLGPVGWTKPDLTHDSYLLTTRYGGSTYMRKHLVRSSQPWRYEGVVHEFVTCDVEGLTEGVLEWPQVIVNHDGARAHDPETYVKDAALLAEDLRRDPTNTRTAFYLAQSYFDAGLVREAVRAYHRRIDLGGGWSEEIYMSKYKIGRTHQIAKDWELAVAAYLDAWDFSPRRAEPLFQIANLYHHQAKRHLACEFYRLGAAIPLPDHTALFVERDIYDYLLPLERAVACYWAGQHAEGVMVADELLASGKLPDGFRETVENNRRLSLQHLGQPA